MCLLNVLDVLSSYPACEKVIHGFTLEDVLTMMLGITDSFCGNFMKCADSLTWKFNSTVITF